MLKTFLTGIRKQRCIGAQKAVAQVNGWSATGESAMQKEFKFNDFKEASNFILRYTEYSQKVGATPQWSNVYNSVNVTLTNTEFDSVSTKEVEVAKYLDMVETVKVTNHLNIDDHLSFEQIIERA